MGRDGIDHNQGNSISNFHKHLNLKKNRNSMSKLIDLTGLEAFLAKLKEWTNSVVNTAKSALQTNIDKKVDKTTTVNGHALSGNVTVSKSDVGLSNVTNDAQVKRSEMGAASGVATLDANKKLNTAQLPALKTVNGTSIVGSGNISIDLTLFKVVTSLPSSGIDATKIYLVKSGSSGAQNIYTEYMYVNSAWEKLGEYQSTVDLTPYAKKTELTALQNGPITVGTVELDDLDTLHDVSGKTHYIVMTDEKNVGTLELISDNNGHVVTQILTTHYGLTPTSGGVSSPMDGYLGSSLSGTHYDDKIFTYFRSYNVSSPNIGVNPGQWTKWKDISLVNTVSIIAGSGYLTSSDIATTEEVEALFD